MSCNRIVLMRLINCACCYAVYGCFSHAPHVRRIGAGVARMNTCGGVWIAGATQQSMKDLEGPRPPPRCLEDTLTISMRMKRPHTQQLLCSMTSLRAGAAGRPAMWLTRSSRRSRVPTAKSTHMNCSISRVRGPLAHRHTACTVGARPESAKQHLHHAWSCCARGQHPVLPRKID